MALVTKNKVITVDSNNSYKVYPIDDTINDTITKPSYDSIINKITPYLKYIEPALIILIILSILIAPFALAAFSLVGELIYLAIFSAIFFLIIKLMKKAYSYKKVFQLSIHAATLPILLGFVATTLGIQIPFLLGTGILFVFMFLVINQIS
jgi:hypothetical protein